VTLAIASGRCVRQPPILGVGTFAHAKDYRIFSRVQESFGIAWARRHDDLFLPGKAALHSKGINGPRQFFPLAGRSAWRISALNPQPAGLTSQYSETAESRARLAQSPSVADADSQTRANPTPAKHGQDGNALRPTSRQGLPPGAGSTLYYETQQRCIAGSARQFILRTLTL